MNSIGNILKRFGLISFKGSKELLEASLDPASLWRLCHVTGKTFPSVFRHANHQPSDGGQQRRNKFGGIG